MERKKPKLRVEPETKRSVPPFSIKTPAAPDTPAAPKPESAVIRLPATADELAEKRKPQLHLKKPEAVNLPFKVTNEPLPAPVVKLVASMPTRVEEKDFLNTKDIPQTEEEKARHLFLTNYCATYGNVSAEEGERAFQEFRNTQAYAKAVAKNPELRHQHSEMFRRNTQLSLSVHAVLIGLFLALFIYLRINAPF
jgi:hypothetical protein